MRLEPSNPFIITLIIIYYIFWSITYLKAIIIGFKQKTYAIPMPIICLNISWEFLYTFIYPNSVALATVLNGFWFGLDVLVLFTLLLYGKQAQVWQPIKKIFYPLIPFTITAAVIGFITFRTYYGDITGTESAYFLNLWISLAFIMFLYYRRETLIGISYALAWFKMLGTVFTTIVIHFTYWTVKPDVPAFSIMDFLGIVIFIIDCYYIYLVYYYKKKLSQK